MLIRVEHTTELTYDVPIAEAYTELRLRPLEGGGQHCSSFRVATDPPGLRVREYRDHFGNAVHHFDLLESHERLAVTSVSEVVTPAAFVNGRRPPTPLELHDYLHPTGYPPFAGPIRSFAARPRADRRVRPRGRRPRLRRRAADPRRLQGLGQGDADRAGAPPG